MDNPWISSISTRIYPPSTDIYPDASGCIHGSPYSVTMLERIMNMVLNNHYITHVLLYLSYALSNRALNFAVSLKCGTIIVLFRKRKFVFFRGRIRGVANLPALNDWWLCYTIAFQKRVASLTRRMQGRRTVCPFTLAKNVEAIRTPVDVKQLKVRYIQFQGEEMLIH